MYLKDLPEIFARDLEIGSTIYLIRKVSNEVLKTYLEALIIGNKPFVEVKWNNQHKYRLDLTNNLVLAENATQRHRQDMKAWYSVWEPQRLKLIDLFWEQKKTKKRYLP